MTTLRRTDELLHTFPKDLVLEDALAVTVRPLVPSDEPQLARFFRQIPERDRWWLREDVGSAEVVHGWLANLNYERMLPLIALVGDAIVADTHRCTGAASARERTWPRCGWWWRRPTAAAASRTRCWPN